ncbi:sugar ABC transporter substrate-binding protein [Xaviernesmea oryzae]|uniref:Sugar ABC transporter substrate-binding protein n=1 Tax=Xaviernesmea oryzae TaxID=464029 RepID=A0A1Q9B3V9_9HYPH|nr:sugar ABC transporter substrate-binding protein [Xaviernesmea oryzae]
MEAQASVKVSSPNKERRAGVDYALVDINKTVLGLLQSVKAADSFKGFGGGRGPAPNLPLGVGDIVQVSIFESQSGGLFVPSDAGSRPGNYVTLPNQTIGKDGAIMVPYAGRIPVAGRSVESVQNDIQKRLQNRAIEPQVIVSKVTTRSAQVAVLGDVNGATKIELNEGGDRILDLISQAGGLSTPGLETYVTLQRGNRTATILYDDLTKTPSENIFAQPGDTIIVNRERRTYLAFGASGTNGRFDFEDARLTLGEALGKAGGLLDARANPEQVLLYRRVNRELLARLGVDVRRFVDTEIPVIFRADMRDPATMFVAQQLPMQDKDIIFVTNADSIELLKFLDLVNSVTSTASGASSDVITTRDAIRKF